MQGAAMGEEDPGAGPLGGNPGARYLNRNPGARYLESGCQVPE